MHDLPNVFSKQVLPSSATKRHWHMKVSRHKQFFVVLLKTYSRFCHYVCSLTQLFLFLESDFQLLFRAMIASHMHP